MSTTIEKRIAALEKKVEGLQKQQQPSEPDSRAWIDDIYGKFVNDPIFEQAMKLGRKYRRSLRPTGDKRKSGK